MTQFPQWAAFDPDAPPRLPAIPDHPGRVVALVAGEAAVADGWAGHLAADLARAWTAAGHRVVLADAALIRPTLHDVLETSNEEGLADALLYGASVRRVARPVEGEGFFLLTAGTVVADAAAALGSPRWGRFCQGFRHAGVTLAVFIPAGEAGYQDVVARATDVVCLCASDEDPEAYLDPGDERVRCVLGAAGGTPPAVRAAAPREEEPEPLTDPLAAVGEDPLLAPPQVPGIEEILQETPDVPDFGDEPQLPAQAAGLEAVDPDEEPALGRPSSRRNALLFALLVVLLGVVAAAWFGYLEIPGVTFPRGASTQAAPPAVTAEPEPAAAAPTPTTGVMAFSVALGAYRDEAQARGRADTLSQRSPGHLFMVIPVEVDGTVYHRLMVGPARDSADAAALAGAVAAEVGADPEGWVIRPTPRAFQLGEMASLQAARRRVDVLRGLGVPAYVLAVDYSDASTRYRVYAGAYVDEAEASRLLGILTDRGLSSASLTARIGRVPE